MNENSRLRILVVGAIVLALFSALFARLWYLQVISGDSYAAAAEGNRVRTVAREAPRGRILDRRGRVLVDNRTANVVAVSRSLVGEERERVVSELSELLRIPVPEIEDRLEDFRYADFRPIPVATEVDEATLVAIREREDDLPGVEATQSAVRVYPHGHLAAHVLGYVGEINDQELEDRADEGYELGNTIGKVGIERAYETDLRGISGVEFYEVDRSGEVVRELGERESEQGDDVQLGVDLDVQIAAEDALLSFIELAREGGRPATGGAVVVLDATDGTVVAMASYPTFEPAGFVHGISTEVWEELNKPERNLPLNNRAIQGLYPPGSTFKLVTSIAGLSSGVITPETTILDQGSIEIGDRRFRNAGGKSYGNVALPRALTVSSDVYFYSASAAIDVLEGQDEEIQRIARLFGFDQPSGIELPFEQDGRVPDREWKRTVNAANSDAFPNATWYTGDTVNIGIGQGDLLATPIQLASAYATLGNGGTVFKPHVGARVIDRFGAVVREVEGQPVSEVTPLQEHPEWRSIILSGLQGTVSNREGTAFNAFAGYSGPPVAAKTGTSQTRGREDASLFVGMFPANAPKYVVAAIVEEGGAGSDIAAPVVRRVIEEIVRTEADSSLPPIGTLIAPPSDTTSTTAPVAPEDLVPDGLVPEQVPVPERKPDGEDEDRE
ncbi:MAG: penicillin-binding protein 2 [Actinobacteria bacterium]|nr:penicillin-binding protein 2 [Actinomycetota bacterium]